MTSSYEKTSSLEASSEAISDTRVTEAASDSSMTTPAAGEAAAAVPSATEGKAAAITTASSSSATAEKLQRGQSYHFSTKSKQRQSKNSSNPSSKRLEGSDFSSHHRRATSVRIRPTYIQDEDPNLPQPPVSISVASPDEEDEPSSKLMDNTLSNRLDPVLHGNEAAVHRGRRRSLPRVPIYHGGEEPAEPSQWSPYSPSQQVTSHQPADFQFDSNMDQFDAFFARSKQQQQYAAPEVNIEVPSDSDSSRRPSKYTLSNASSVQDIYAEMAVAASQAEKGANTRPRSQFQPANQPVRRVSQQQSDFLNARPQVLDRRKSHTGVTPARRYSMRCQQQQQQPQQRPRTTNLTGGYLQSSGQMLSVPKSRPRGSSLPGNIEVVNQDDIYRLRNFSKAGKKIINRGDSVKKARSRSSLASTNSSVDILSSRTNSGEDFSAPGSECSSRRPSTKGSRRGSHRSTTAASALAEEEGPKQYRVAMLGAASVGKSSLTSQFLSSDHMNTYDTVEDDVQKVVSVAVDGKEAQMVFIDHAYSDMAIENQIATYMPDGYMIVFAVDDSESLDEAEAILTYLKSEDILNKHAVILVANKTDLVRSRVISTNGGKSLAIKYGCKYIETSPGINHNVDELLVGMLIQIQLREAKCQDETQHKKKGGGLKVLDLLEKVWKMQDSKSKSCGNLHVL